MSPDGKVRWTSKWYEKLDEKMSRKTRAQEVDMDHGSAGDLFFDPVELERHRQDHQASPEFVGDIRPLEEMPESVEQKVLARLDCDAYVFMKDAGRKPWRFWIPLEHGRPPQHWQYIFGVDISNGSGNSNSVISVFSPDAGMIVAKWWDAFTSPEELSMVAARAGAWFGGHSPPPLMVWENNGPGGIFGRKLVLKLGYPHYYRDKAMDVKSPKNSRNSEKWGWSSSPTKKEQMLGLYRDALARNAIIVRCQESLDEAGDYIYVNGVPMPSRLREEVGGGAGLHGDHCIADGLCWLGADESTARRQFQPKAPTGSFAWRRERHLRELKKRED